MRAIVADDEQHLAEDLRRRLVQLWPELQIVAVLHDGISAAQALEELKPDIAFLDIRMPGQSGLDAASAAAANCRVVFVTAFDDHAVQAFEQAAVDYLLKPVSDERLARCVDRLQQRSSATPDALLLRLQQLLATQNKPEFLRWLRIQVGQSVRMVAVEEVCYFQSADKYTTVLTRDAELLLRTPLKDLISQLDPDAFWQVHRGTLVNAKQIVLAHHDLLGKLTLTLRDRTEKVAVSRSYAHLFRQM
jgi:DNA-binding LytR/AlgR family response regulator